MKSCLFLVSILLISSLSFAQNVSVLDGMAPIGVASGAGTSLSGFEHYSPFSGSLSAGIPLYHIAGRGEAAVDLTWNLQTSWMAWKESGGSSPFIPVDPYPGSYPNAAPNAAGLGVAGGVFSRTGANYTSCSGSWRPSSTVTTLIFAAGNGAQINLVDTATKGQAFAVPNPCTSSPSNWDAHRGTSFRSVDGSNLQFNADAPVLDWNPNGTAPGTAGRGRALASGYLVFPNGVTYRIDSSKVSWIRDRNGNKITFNYANGVPYALDWYVSVLAPTQILDSENRLTTINYNDSNCGGCTSLTYQGAGGANRVIQIHLTNLSNGLLRSGSVSNMGALFPEGFQTTYNFDPILCSSIQLPDGSSYSFRYDKYGEIARVNLPTSGAMEYDYGDGHNGSGDGFEGSSTDANPVMIYRRLQERREYALGGSTVTLRTQYTVNYANSQTTNIETALDGNGNILAQTVHTIDGSPTDALGVAGTGCNAWNEGMEAHTLYGIAPQQIQVDMALASQSGCMSNPQIVSKTTTLLDTSQVSQTIYSYDQYGNVTDEYDYDWGSASKGALLRKIKTSYLWSNNGAYTSPSVNLIQAPYTSTIYDGSGNQVAVTSWHYDESALQDAAAIGHDPNYGTGFTLRANVTSVLRWWNTVNNNVVSAMAYDIAGNVVAVTDPAGHVTRFNYDDDGASEYALPTSTSNALNQVSRASYDYFINKPVSTTDRNGKVTSYSYNDPLDRLTQTLQPNGGYVTLSYPSPTTVLQVQDQNTATDSHLQSKTVFDGMGRVIESGMFNGPSHYIATTKSYDALGRVARTTNPSEPGDGLNYPTQYVYDTLGRLKQVIAQDGTSATTSYSGNKTINQDESGKEKDYTYDALGRLINVKEDPNELKYTTDYQYL